MDIVALLIKWSNMLTNHDIWREENDSGLWTIESEYGEYLQNGSRKVQSPISKWLVFDDAIVSKKDLPAFL